MSSGKCTPIYILLYEIIAAHINRKNEVLLYFRSLGVKKYIKVANAKVLAACAEKNP